MFWWTKKDEEIKQLQDTVKVLNEKINKTNKTVNMLKRVVKNAKDEPTYDIQYTVYNDYFKQSFSIIPKLYLYIYKEEYVIELSNMIFTIDKTLTDCSLNVVGGIAYFNCKVHKGDKPMYFEYVIDYKRSKYVCAEVDYEPKTENEENETGAGVV